MVRRHTRRGLTFIEVLVVIVVIGVLIALLIPPVSVSHEAARRSTCINNMKQIGLGLQNFNNNFNHLPGSASVDPGTRTVGGWSFLERILPFMDFEAEYKALYKDELTPEKPSGGTADQQVAARALLNRPMKVYFCPSNSNKKFPDPAARPPAGALTNYKAMGGTFAAALAMAADDTRTPPYDPTDPKKFPDGAMFPGPGLRFADIPDGTSKTIAVAETIDDICSRWTVGKEATMFGLPSSMAGQIKHLTAHGDFWGPSDYDGQFGPTSAVDLNKGERPYVGFDFSPGGADYAGGGPGSTQYAADDRSMGFGEENPPNYGPSSGHTAVVNHLFVDGSVHAISKQIDGAAYMFLITRNNADPFPL
ncbi:MAG: DUF1559 domain-containing protein [Thermoguttaceae bacterium]|jgi:prepilin-type N-terminal cleavage/methylation domain-containing protein